MTEKTPIKVVRYMMARSLVSPFTEYEPQGLENQVNALLAEGWQPWGPPGEDIYSFFQVMVKYAEEK